jgi:glutamate carboxypeptidase
MSSASQLISSIIETERVALDQTIDDVRNLALTNSGTANVEGTAEVQDGLRKRFERLGMACSVTASAAGKRVDDKGDVRPITYGPVLRASLGPEHRRRVLVLGHADTVFGPSSSFQDVRRDGDLLRGPGVTDMKGGLVMLIRAIDSIQRNDLAPGLGIDVLVNSDEEIGSFGSSPSFADAASKATSGVALVLEPRLPDGTHAGARPASANIDLVISGKSAHAGRALAEGRNAVVAASELSVFVGSLTGKRPSLGVNVASMSGGGPLNAVPHLCIVRVNLRSPHTEDLEWALAEIDRFSNEIDYVRGVETVRHGGVHRPAKPWTASSRALAEMVTEVNNSVALPTGFTDTGGVCDGNNLTAEGLAVVDTLGVSGAGIHTDDEHTPTSTWPQHVAMLTSLIHEIATNDLEST